MHGSEKKLGKKKLLRVIKRISDKEKRIVDQRCHEISKEIVEKTERHDSVIVIGDLKGIGNRNTGRGKRVNRIGGRGPYGFRPLRGTQALKDEILFLSQSRMKIYISKD